MITELRQPVIFFLAFINQLTNILVNCTSTTAWLLTVSPKGLIRPTPLYLLGFEQGFLQCFDKKKCLCSAGHILGLGMEDLFVCLCCCLTSQSTAEIILGCSVTLTTLFLGRLRPKKRFHDQSLLKNSDGPENRTRDLLITSQTCIPLCYRAQPWHRGNQNHGYSPAPRGLWLHNFKPVKENCQKKKHLT